MKKKYDIRTDLQPLSSEEISKHKDFDKLLADFELGKNNADEPEGNVIPIIGYIKKYSLAAAVVLLLSGMIWKLINDSYQSQLYLPSDQMVNQYKLEPPLLALDVQKTTFVIEDVQKETLLEYVSGSKIKVPASAFIDKNGQPVKGKVDIQYREFADPVDLFLSDIPLELEAQKIIQSYGMMEIKGFQDGEAVFIAHDRTLEVQLRASIEPDQLQNDNSIHHFNGSVADWEFSKTNQVTILDSILPDKGSIPNENELRTMIEQEMIASKPLDPPILGIPSEMQLFDVDIDLNKFPELKKYNEALQFLVKKKNLKAEIFDQEWNSMDLQYQTDRSFVIQLKRFDDEALIVENLEVYPALIPNASDIESYTAEVDRFKQELDQWNAEVDERISEFKPDSISGMRYLVMNEFDIAEFGLWNCGQELKAGLANEHNIEFKDEKGTDLLPARFFCFDRIAHTYYFSNSSNILPSDDMVVWILDDSDELYWNAGNINDERNAIKMRFAGKLEERRQLYEILSA